MQVADLQHQNLQRVRGQQPVVRPQQPALVVAPGLRPVQDTTVMSECTALQTCNANAGSSSRLVDTGIHVHLRKAVEAEPG